MERLAERAWSHFGQVDLLFNNAGVAGGGPLLDATATELLAAFDAQAPYKEGDDRYEVDAIIARAMAAMQEGKS